MMINVRAVLSPISILQQCSSASDLSVGTSGYVKDLHDSIKTTETDLIRSDEHGGGVNSGPLILQNTISLTELLLGALYPSLCLH